MNGVFLYVLTFYFILNADFFVLYLHYITYLCLRYGCLFLTLHESSLLKTVLFMLSVI